MPCLDIFLLNAGDIPMYEKDENGSILVLTLGSARFIRHENNWMARNLFNISGLRIISWEITSERQRRKPSREETNSRGWRVNMFDSLLF